jgi:hypothetical protein
MIKLSKFSELQSTDETFVNFGLQPISNRFLAADNPEEVPRYPIELCICKDTGIVYLARPFPIEELKPQYSWLTCFEPEDHLDDLVKVITKLPGINKNSIFGAYSFKDDSTLERLNALNYSNTWRIDPVKQLGVEDSCANVETYQAAFNEENAENIKQENGAADVLIVRHVVEHAYDISRFIKSLQKLVTKDGYIVWELPDCERPIALGDCTTIWEEHVYYFTSFTFKQLLLLAGQEIVHFESVEYPLENSIIAITKMTEKNDFKLNPDDKLLQKEIQRANSFAVAINQRKLILREKLEAIRAQGKTIALFGAGHLSIAFLSLMGITDLIDCVLDDNDNKKGMKMPIGNLDIIDSEALYDQDISVCLLSLNPQNQPKVIAKHQKYIDQGGVFASIFPGSNSYLEDIL